VVAAGDGGLAWIVGLMDSTWVQLLLGLLVIAGFFLAVAAGVLLLAWAPVERPPSLPARWHGRISRERLRCVVYRGATALGSVARWLRPPAAVVARVSAALRHPARLVALGFAAAVLVGTGLLSLPFATETGNGAGWVTALFTATSAVCVTGLVIEDTGSFWSGFGEAVILGLIQIGGFGIMTLASLLGLLVARRLRIRLQLGTQAETKTLGVGDIRRVVLGVLRVSLIVEAVVAVVLTWRFADGYGETWGRAGYLGLFHAV
jgi:trk system potassium uptake protein